MKWIIAIILLINSCAYPMRQDINQAKTETSFLQIPRDVLILFLQEIAHNDFKNDTHSLLSLRRSCKRMKELIDGQSVPLINQLSAHALQQKKYIYRNKIDFASIEAAIAVGSPQSRDWLKLYLQGTNSETAQMAAANLFGCYLDSGRLTSRAKIAKLKILIDAGISVDLRSPIRGDTPLMRSIMHADPQLVSFFLKQKANSKVINDFDFNALDLLKRRYKKAVRENNQQDIANLENIGNLLDVQIKQQEKAGCLIQ